MRLWREAATARSAFDNSHRPAEKSVGGSLTNSSGDAGERNGSRSAFAAGDMVASRYKIVRLIGSASSVE